MSATIRVDGRPPTLYAPVDDVGSADDGRPILVGLDLWERAREALLANGRAVGVRLPNTLDITAAADLLRPTSLLLLEFPSFGDGRAYSQARLLREALGYTGELRGTGAAVVRDQLLGMARCGFDSLELRSDQRAEECLAALREFSLAYQPAIDSLPRVRDLRRHVA